MEIYNKGNVTVRMRYNLEERQAQGDIFYKENTRIGKVIDDRFYIDTDFILFKGIIKTGEVEEVARCCEGLKDEIEDYARMWKEYDRQSRY